MYTFDYTRPATVAAAEAAFKAGDDGAFMAGGQTLIPTLKQRLRKPSHVIDIGGLAELAGISVAGGAATIGAGVCHADVAASASVRAAIPGLADLAAHIGDPQVRNRGTLGGSIANNDPAADYPAALIALDAMIHTATRAIAAADFFTGMFETALDVGELVVKVAFPIPKRAAYMKFRNPASRYAIVGVMVAETGHGIRVAVTGAGPCVFRALAMEEALAGNFTAAALQNISMSPDNLNSDLHATAEYRAHLVGVMAQRVVASMA
jgi:carbon-monoxide dehydrogenase medium subunit